MGLQPISFPSALFPSLWLFGHSHCFLLPKLNWWINCLMLTGWATTAKPIVRLRQVKMHWFFFFFVAFMFTHLYPYLRTLLCVRYSLLSTFSFYKKYSGNRSDTTINVGFICICGTKSAQPCGFVLLLLYQMSWEPKEVTHSDAPQLKIMLTWFCSSNISYVI